MRSNRAELALLRGKRTPEAVELWVQAFGKGDRKRAEQSSQAIALLLGGPEAGADYFGHLSPNTRLVYAYAITEFFEWVAAKHRRVVSPEDVTRKDAEDYVSWLANRPFSLAAEKLKDGDKKEELEIYKIVERRGRASLEDIVQDASLQLSRAFGLDSKTPDRRGLSYKVRSLITMDVLASTPTMCQLREKYPQAGIKLWEIPEGSRNKRIPLEDVFTYSVREYPQVSRTTISQRVAALSSLWSLFMQGEGNKEPLVKYNVWDLVKKRVNRGLTEERREASRKQKVPSEDVITMLKNTPDRTLVQLRNKAILYAMVFAGLRTSELLALRRDKPENTKQFKSWFEGGEPSVLQLLRKGNKRMRIPYPPAALKVLIEFQGMLERRAAPSYAQNHDPEGQHYVASNDPAWEYQQLLLPDAPLFPPLVFWGNNNRKDYRQSLRRESLGPLLTKVAADAGLSDDACKRIHPHALRHFAANAMAEGGKALREIQAILGHSSITTTEGYLADIEDDVRLSGQREILNYLQKEGAFDDVELEPEERPESRQEVVETYAVEVEEPDDTEPVVTDAEVAVIQRLDEKVPEHELPVAPEYDPEVTVMATTEEPLVESAGKLTALEEGSEKELLESMAADGKSPGSPDWVYEAMADPKATHETVVFNRGGERDAKWLKKHYPWVPKNFGVANLSLLPWYVKARGNITRGGYYRGMPPFPVCSPDQVNPETSTGLKFLEEVERAHSRFVHGDPERGVLPSPLRSVGIVRWYSFFAYQTAKLDAAFQGHFQDSIPSWEPYNSVVLVGDFRAHDDKWLLQWLQDNAHTFRASVDAMKRGVQRGVRDVTDTFFTSAFEGIELITDVPEWMIYNDPVRALYDSDPKQWREMIMWLKNVTGQVLDAARQEDRAEQLDFADEEQKTRARNVRDILLRLQSRVDKLTRAKRTEPDNKDKIRELRDEVRNALYYYVTVASDRGSLGYTQQALNDMSTREFNEVMKQEYERFGILDPNARKYKGKEKISRIITELFPELPFLDEANIFAESQLFNPKWFRIDERNKTIQIDDSERDSLIQQFGQDPELLVRRATRAMWEARERGHEAMWGVMLSYFSWIMPTGQEMEAQVRGIPVVEIGDEEMDLQARKNWLRYWVKKMKDLAVGKREEVQKAEEPVWKQEMEEDEGTGEDALDYQANVALDFLGAASIGEYAASPEELGIQMEEYREEGGYYFNVKRGLLPNRRGTYTHLQGEKPQGWYKVDIFGSKKDRYRPNAPPKFMSPGAVYLSQKQTFVARQLLPSPFRMVSAMTLR